MPHEAVFQHQGKVQEAHLLSVLWSHQRELRHSPQPCEEASQPPVCLWRLFFPKLPQWTSSQQTHENMCLGNHHQRPLQLVGLLQWTPSSITWLHKAELSDLWGPSHEAPLLITLITQGSLVWSLGTYVCQDAYLMLEAEGPVVIYTCLLINRSLLWC